MEITAVLVDETNETPEDLQRIANKAKAVEAAVLAQEKAKAIQEIREIRQSVGSDHELCHDLVYRALKRYTRLFEQPDTEAADAMTAYREAREAMVKIAESI